jgi:hypothetical protein
VYCNGLELHWGGVFRGALEYPSAFDLCARAVLVRVSVLLLMLFMHRSAPAPMLQVRINSTRRAAWHARLGQQPPRVYAPPLRALRVDGGAVSCVRVCVQRMYARQMFNTITRRYVSLLEYRQHGTAAHTRRAHSSSQSPGLDIDDNVDVYGEVTLDTTDACALLAGLSVRGSECVCVCARARVDHSLCVRAACAQGQRREKLYEVDQPRPAHHCQPSALLRVLWCCDRLLSLHCNLSLGGREAVAQAGGSCERAVVQDCRSLSRHRCQ